MRSLSCDCNMFVLISLSLEVLLVLGVAGLEGSINLDQVCAFIRRIDCSLHKYNCFGSPLQGRNHGCRQQSFSFCQDDLVHAVQLRSYNSHLFGFAVGLDAKCEFDDGGQHTYDV